MRKWPRFFVGYLFVRGLIVGACSFGLLCMSCRHSTPSANDVHHAAGVTADKVKHVGVYHEVRQGQTLWSIARTYGIGIQTLARVNQISDTAVLSPGQKLYVPGVTQPREIVSRCPCGKDTVKSVSEAKSLPGLLRPSQQLSTSKVAPITVTNKEALLER